jgi:hypothetical protein
VAGVAALEIDRGSQRLSGGVEDGQRLVAPQLDEPPSALLDTLLGEVGED